MKRCGTCGEPIVKLAKWSKTYYQNRRFCSLKCAAAGRVPPTRLVPKLPETDCDTRWQDLAACAGAEPELFWPLDEAEHGGRVETKPRILDALSYCQRCPVVVQCGAFARDTGSVGVWGNRYIGMTKGRAA